MNADPDPATQINADPDPKPCFQHCQMLATSWRVTKIAGSGYTKTKKNGWDPDPQTKNLSDPTGPRIRITKYVDEKEDSR